MSKQKKILIIIQRSNGDVLLSLKLINTLYEHFQSPRIDLLINDDTIAVAKLFPHIHSILTFSYAKKQNERWSQEKKIFGKIARKYDLSINLTASDRSVMYALLASKFSISAIEKDAEKSWWKKIFLKHYYYFDVNKPILLNNLEPLNFLKIDHEITQDTPTISDEVYKTVKSRLKKNNIKDFLIFHPSAQYKYKIYSKTLRNKLLYLLNSLEVPILITGSNNEIDMKIKKELPLFPNIFDLIGDTTLEEYFALSSLSKAYIGMDTLNMHIAAGQNKPIFAIFGPTRIAMWSPWSNSVRRSGLKDSPLQRYGDISIFQANMPCVACGKAGCNDMHGESECLSNIDPKDIFTEIQDWHLSKKIEPKFAIQTLSHKIPKKIILYIVYGENQGYYDGAKFSFLTFMNWCSDDDSIEVVILTEKPDEFLDYPVKVIQMNSKQLNDWSINGDYHFRIKNRGMAFVMDELNLNSQDKILFFDTDTYFKKSPLPLFDLIQHDQALFYLNEGLIYERKRFDVYVKSLAGKKIEYDGQFYELTKKSALWGSLMVGIMPSMRPSLDWADKLMVKFFDIVPAHTIEPFSLSEILLKKYKMVEGKSFVSLYSTSRKKEHAVGILASFFQNNRKLPIKEQINLAQKTKIKRSIIVILKQRFKNLLKSNVNH